MKSGLKKILVLIMIGCGIYYIANYISLNVYDVGVEEIKLNLDEEAILVNESLNNVSTELMLINKEHGVDKEYKPEDLVIPNITFVEGVSYEEKHVAGVIVTSLEELIDTAENEGIILLGNSGYRSYRTQKELYSTRKRLDGEEVADDYVAKAGFSEHQTGLCIDITNRDGYFTAGTKEAEWLAENCYRFGFIIRYPSGKKDITGVEHEPWHIRYVGRDAAKYIYDNGITLEEYLEE